MQLPDVLDAADVVAGYIVVHKVRTVVKYFSLLRTLGIYSTVIYCEESAELMHLGHIIRYAFEWTGTAVIPSAMEFLDMENFTSMRILCLLFCCSDGTLEQ